MAVLRTPEERFATLPEYPFAPRYVDVAGMRMHYVDEGTADGPPVLMLHGEPSWSYLYRKMIPIIAAAGLRAVAPDLFGFGRSDKPASQDDYTYEAHVRWMTDFVDSLNLRGITLVCQDWGGLIGLRVAAERPDHFARIVAANTFLPTGDRPPGDAFMRWQNFSQTVPEFDAGRIVAGGCRTKLSDDVIAAYSAPYPDQTYVAGARKFPMLVPTKPDDPASDANRRAWDVLRRWEKPFLCAFSDEDPVTRGADRFFKEQVPGCKDQPHTTIPGGGHFLQEDCGEELAKVVVSFIESTPGN
jgi:haloalkane dehalogenase